MRRKLAITQPYVPAYRYPLWDGIVQALRSDGIDARVFFGGDDEQLAIRARRGDGVDAPWAEQVEAKTVRIAPSLPKLVYRRLPPEWSDATLLTEMQASNGNAWSAMMRRRPFVTFGHGKEYTSSGGKVSASLESTLNRRAQHVLTYLPSGRAEVLRRTGLAKDQVTSFNNSTDTTALRHALSELDADDLERFRAAHGVPSDGRVALFLGAMNEHKRIDFLVEAARDVFARDSRAWLIAIGDGPQANLLEALARETGRVTMLGQSGPTDFAPAAATAQLIVNPGRIGLVAVDSLAMKLPVLTADFELHAPEAEYLEEGTTLFTSGATVQEYSDLWAQFPANDQADWDAGPTLESSVETIAKVLREVVRQE
jgi:glycosyltransferase involved in cell wall biosynthesis